MLSWMAWTPPTAIFFAVIAAMLAAMTVWELLSPTVERKGAILPMPTTRGDRFFVGLLASAYLHLAWLGWTELSLWWAVAASAVVIIVLLRWG